MEKIINVTNLNFSYSSKEVLKQINFDIKKGEIIGLLGENGSGKTTLLDCLYGFLDSSGAISVMYKRPNVNDDDFKKRISYIQDFPNLLDYLTAEQYIAFICKLEDINYNLKKDEIYHLIELFDLCEDYKTKLIKDFSFGMKKKIQIIGEMILHKELIFIDEPTNGLDIKMIILLKKLIKAESKKYSSTMIISSHNTQFLEEVCDRVLVFDKHYIVKEIELSNEVNLESEFLNIKKVGELNYD
ncbi:ABC transporter ATP-binding protein [Amedibacillus sp. YH-ame10]